MTEIRKRIRYLYRNEFSKNPLSSSSIARIKFSLWVLRKLIFVVPPAHRMQYLDFYEEYTKVHLKSWEECSKAMENIAKRYKQHLKRKRKVYETN